LITLHSPIATQQKLVIESRRRTSALAASSLIDTDFSSIASALNRIVAAAAGSANIAEDAVSALGSKLGKLGVRGIAAALQLHTDIVRVRAAVGVAGTADVARETIGVGCALRRGGGSECQGHGDDCRLDGDTGHVVTGGCFIDEYVRLLVVLMIVQVGCMYTKGS
jgi:hypothetical protein